MSRREQLEEMLKANPTDAFLNYALAMEFASARETPAALDQFEHVIQLDPNYVAAYFQKGQVLARQGEDEAARDVVVRGIDVARRVGNAHAESEMRGFLETL